MRVCGCVGVCVGVGVCVCGGGLAVRLRSTSGLWFPSGFSLKIRTKGNNAFK